MNTYWYYGSFDINIEDIVKEDINEENSILIDYDIFNKRFVGINKEYNYEKNLIINNTNLYTKDDQKRMKNILKLFIPHINKLQLIDSKHIKSKNLYIVTNKSPKDIYNNLYIKPFINYDSFINNITKIIHIGKVIELTI